MKKGHEEVIPGDVELTPPHHIFHLIIYSLI